MDTKMIKDPIHGSIGFTGEKELCLKNLLSEPYFQRLRRVKQLGFSDYVFPSASHSRFSHSLGVYEVARRLLSVIEPSVREGKWSDKGFACLAAALLHDIGHGMFSHTFENTIKLYEDKKTPEQKEGGLSSAVRHEEISLKIIMDEESGVHKSLLEMGGKEFPNLVANMIGRKDKKCVYTSIVSGQLDADRLDYVKRDSYFAGVSSGGIDLAWLMRNFRKGENNGCEFLYVDSKAYVSLEQFVVTLFHLYPTLYLHKRTRGVEYMFSLLMRQVIEHVEGGSVGKTGLPKNHPFVRFFCKPEDIRNFLYLDDSVFWSSLYYFDEAPDEKIKTLANRIIERKFYRMQDLWKEADRIFAEDFCRTKLDANSRNSIFDKVCSDVAAELQSLDGRGCWTEDCYYDSYPRGIYKIGNKKGGDPQQINVQVGGEIVDIASISPIVASAASFKIHRIYYDETQPGLEDRLKKEIRQRMKSKMKEELRKLK